MKWWWRQVPRWNWRRYGPINIRLAWFALRSRGGNRPTTNSRETKRSFRVKLSKILIQPDVTDSDLLKILQWCPMKKKPSRYLVFWSSCHWNMGRKSLTKFAPPSSFGGSYLRSYGTQEDSFDTVGKVFKSTFWPSY